MEQKNLEKIRSCGGRVTRVRREIVGILEKAGCLLARQEIVSQLESIGFKPDRSTIYRELSFLAGNRIANAISISGTDYYEIPHSHHYHLVCLECRRIDKVKISNNFEKQETELGGKNGFKITGHTLEFFGYCRKCGEN